ncbi:MAG: ornithine carbamoyltransferase [Pirellulaceae bacterium]|nr:ornithine carbamoyltransferase [Pirellulaceae bacterium]
MRHLLTINDLTSNEIEEILSIATDLKRRYERGERPPELAGRVLGLLFSKPSLRTRVSFEAGMTHLGGTSLYLGQDVGWGTRESIADFAKVISQYVDVIVCRTHGHEMVVELAKHSDCPVINGLTDQSHPCQALADVMTLRELKGQNGSKKLTFVGDANNVSRSLALACTKLGISFAIAAPSSYQFNSSLLDSLQKMNSKVEITQTDDPRVALKDASAVYTDVWSSMGFENETETRKKDFANYQVNARMMEFAPSDAVFMHCLPAHRGEEVSAEVIDGPQSVIVKQAANRMHVQKGLLLWLIKKSQA